MKVRFMSDIHNEFSLYHIHAMPDEHQQILVLAGDIGLADKEHTLKPFLEDSCDRFRAVIMVMGNHEHYNYSVDKTQSKIRYFVERDNFFILENESIEIDDVVFFGATLWTSMDNRSPLVEYNAQLWMNDYKKIRIDQHKRKFVPSDSINMHNITKRHMQKFLSSCQDKKTVFVTHHAPSMKSVKHHRYNDVSDLDFCYASDLFEWLQEQDSQPLLWIHGHVHESYDYMMGKTRVVSNCRGYNDQCFDFSPKWTIEV